MKLGKMPARHDKRTLLFENYLDKAALPAPPESFGHDDLVKWPWEMLGNDIYGDCVWAGAAHETMLWNAERKKRVFFNEYGVLSDYGKVTGFTSSDPSTDRGTNVLDALKYRRKVGVRDSRGRRHKIGGFVALRPGNLDHLNAALYLFGAVGIGILFPHSAMDQFNAGQPWSVVHSKTDGGHYIPLVRRWPGNYACVTWSKLQTMTQEFYVKYCDEAYAIFSPEMLVKGKSLEGFNVAQLRADLAAVA